MYGSDPVAVETAGGSTYYRPVPPQLPPEAVDDRLQGREDTNLVIPVNQLLANDYDPNGDPVSVTSVGNAVGGTVSLVDGQVLFEPDPDFNGEATFEYTISDGNGGTNTATATVDVAAVNDGPVLEMDDFTFATTEQVTSQFQHDITNFIDVLTDVQEGQQLNPAFVNGAGPITLDDQDREVTVSLHTDGAGHQNVIGYYIINPDGSFGQPQLVFPNASIPPHQPGDTVSLGVLPAGTTFGLFMIQNAANSPLVQQVANGEAEFTFVQPDGDPATLFDGAPPQLRVHAPDADPSTGALISQPVFHTAADSDASFNGQPINTLALNSDGQQHVAAGVGTETDRIAVGWEDLTGGGDRDYNDVILEIDVGEAQVSHVNPANVGEGANLTLSDIDSPDMSGAMFRIADGFQEGDTLQLTGGYSIGPDGAVLDASAQPTGISVVGGGFGGDAANPNGLTFTGAAPVAVYQAVMGAITFVNEDADPGIRTLHASVTDDYGSTSDVDVQQLVVSAAGTQMVMGTEANETLNGGGASEVLFGADGNDTINAGGGNDLVIGGAGDDTLNGGNGNDTLFGGKGDDTLRGGANNDTYRFERGDGADIIEDAGGTDTLQLGAGIDAEDLEIAVQGQDVVVTVKGADGGDTGDRIVVKNGMNAQNRVEAIKLADGSVINLNLSSSANSSGQLNFGNTQLNQMQFWKSGVGSGAEAMAGQMAAALAAVAAGAVALNPEIANAAEAVADSTAIADDMASIQAAVSSAMVQVQAISGAQIVADLQSLPTPSNGAVAPQVTTIADILSAEAAAPIVLPAAPIAPPASQVITPEPTPAAPQVAAAEDIVSAEAPEAAAIPVPQTNFVATAAEMQPAVTAADYFDAPAILADDIGTTAEDTTLTFSVGDLLGNDSDPEGGLLQIVAVGGAIGGSVILIGGQITFAPDPNFNGIAGFRYTVRDEVGNLTTANAIVHVAAVNDAPVPGDETFGGTEDTALIIAPHLLLANDGDVDGDALSVSAVGNAVGGSVALDGSGNVVFRPDPDFNGTASFQYMASDGEGGTATGTATVLVAAVNDNPVAIADVAAGIEDQALTIAAASLLANDSDMEGNLLGLSAVGSPVGGSVALDGNGDVVFTPDPDFNGTASFQYTVSDGQGGSSTALAVLNIAAINDNPVAGAETIGGTEDTPLLIAPALLLANDTDLDGDTLVVSAVANAVGGSVALDGDGNVVFTPAADFNGAASFDYTVADGAGGFSTATVTVVLAAVNDAPAITGELISGTEDVVVTMTAASLLANDTDVDGNPLSISAVGNAVGGSVALDGSGNVVFTPAANYNGAATFDYAVSDGLGGLTWATAAVALAAVNDAPVAGANSFTMNEDTSLSISVASLLANDTDADGNPLTVTGVFGASNGTVSLSGGNITFTPGANFYGNASFQYTVSDGHGGATTAAVSITVNDVAEPVIPPMPDPPGHWEGGNESSSETYFVPDPGHYTWNGSVWVWNPAPPPPIDYGGLPVILDLNGDGVDLVSVNESTAYFDMNADGHLDRMGWVGAQDGLLAYDHNRDGDISRRDEIAFADYLPGAQTDLEGLRAFDSNEDGVLTAEDAEWAKFGVWQDADQDGATDTGEFKSLDEIGIAGISLTSDGNLREDQGNTVFGETAFYKTDGSTGIAGDVCLAYESGVPPPPSIDSQLANLKQMMAAFVPEPNQQVANEPSLLSSEPTSLAAMAEKEEQVA